MFKKFEINSVHAKVDDRLKKYVQRKIGNLDKYVSRHNRESAHAEVHLKDVKTKDKMHAVCEVTLRLPQKTIVVKEKALNMYAAVDIVEAKLKQQLQKYKDLHGSGKLHRRLMGRLRRKSTV